jgi:SAC3 family protein LENG8/THP3
MTSIEQIGKSDSIQYVTGTCTDIDKPYVRLHLYFDTQPDPATIRPESVLRESLRLVIRREAEGEAYDLIRDQYMSICQDMKLQGIMSAFAVEVRESMAVAALRARISREEGVRIDIQTFSDCLLHLSSLYHRNPDQPRELEFSIYRFLFWSALACSRPEEAQHVNSALKAISSDRDKACVRHALRIQSAVGLGDYYTYFKYALSAPTCPLHSC